jgi:hypothetical protein
MSADLQSVRAAVIRIERYTRRAKGKVWSGERRELVNAMADVAEVGEISRRLYKLLEAELRGSETL